MRIILFVTILLMLIACNSESDQPAELRLTSKERRRIDTLVANGVTEMRPRYDSTCTANFETSVAAATDSIVQRRLEDELRLRSRIPLRNTSAQ